MGENFAGLSSSINCEQAAAFVWRKSFSRNYLGTYLKSGSNQLKCEFSFKRIFISDDLENLFKGNLVNSCSVWLINQFVRSFLSDPESLFKERVNDFPRNKIESYEESMVRAINETDMTRDWLDLLSSPANSSAQMLEISSSHSSAEGRSETVH